MNNAEWFTAHLQTSAEGLVWGVQQALPERLYVVPPGDPHRGGTLGAWPIARHVCHMTYYERNCVLPSMRQWLGAARPTMDGYDDEGCWDGSPNMDRFIAEFLQARREQIALLAQYSPEAWDEARDAVWGPVTLRWVVSKTYQHTFEHGSTIMRIALFWEGFARYAQDQQERSREQPV